MHPGGGGGSASVTPRSAISLHERSYTTAKLRLHRQAVCELMHSFAKARVLPGVLLLAEVHDYVATWADGMNLHRASLLLWSFAMLRLKDGAAHESAAALTARVAEVLESRDYEEGNHHVSATVARLL